MASRHVATNFPEQIKETRERIRDSFKRSHEALQEREAVLLSRVDEVEEEYYSKTEKLNKLIESLDKNKSLTSDTLTDNELNETYQQICSVIDTKIKQLTKQTDTSIEFSWRFLFGVLTAVSSRQLFSLVVRDNTLHMRREDAGGK